MTGISYYKYDNCYKAKQIEDNLPLNTFLTSNFNIENVSSVSECANKSLLQSVDKGGAAQYFLMSDLCNNTQKSNCYIPKKNIGSTFDEILKPLRDLFGDNLDDNFDYSRIPAFSGLNKLALESSNNLYIDDINNDENNNSLKCLKYTIDDKVYAPKRNFALYKSYDIDPNKLYLAKNIKNYNYYENKLNDLKDYEYLLKLPQNLVVGDNENAGPVFNAFKDYICNPSESNKKSIFKREIDKLDKKYDNLVDALNEISSDLSAINILSENASNTILAIQVQIDNKKKELDNLFGLGGANDGKLSDINYIKNIKIFEITILILVIISIIFIINKK